MIKFLYILITLLIFSCNKTERNFQNKDKIDSKSPMVKKYYYGFGRYSHPLYLYDEFEMKDSTNFKNAYYIGFYRDNRLIKIEKYLRQNFEFGFIYNYSENGDLDKVINLPIKTEK
ncbi:hypothetical protein [Algoriella sp.]|uniref:hypothetical protein n=1 Tax=Algoriella sp. TaxID=1872434 RepID=UPI002FC5DE88